MPEPKSDAIVIDFCQLLKQERAKARSKKKKNKQLTTSESNSTSGIINHSTNNATEN